MTTTTTYPGRAPERPFVLVVDDDQNLRDSIKDLLEFEGHPAKTAEHGLAALQLLESEGMAPCLILLDLMMPVMDGWQFLKAVHGGRDRALAEVPLIVVSALDDNGELQSRYGCQVMGKPVDIDRLLDAAKRYCGV